MSKNEIVYVFKFLFILILPFSAILFGVNFAFDYFHIFKNDSTYLDSVRKSILVLFMMAIFSIWNQNKRPRMLVVDSTELTKTMAIFNTILFLFLASCIMFLENFLFVKFTKVNNNQMQYSNFNFNLLILTIITLIFLFKKLKTIKQ